MAKQDGPLANLKIASPCSADWDLMAGDDRKRFCGECRMHVYNLSGMTKYDAENLLRLSEGRLCVRYFQRSDGTVLTRDCPVGWARVKQRLSIMASAASMLLISLFGGMLVLATFRKGTRIVKKIHIPFVTPTTEPVLMGAIAMPSPTPKASASPVKKEAQKEIDRELRERVLKQAGV